ncbi:EcoAI/FtnUII family type I restriction enzme subunit R [uncultured Prevotella sp.]|uniref:EcoAI/FtnUII family type I restriction enzme subunit R n=1 Tax=uncultured Prevotella sp. TaxID=159272 RepID=UPI0028039347|nr:DEAD/DEAH box helicase family protein [uncultured Prevotella sp.]
MDVNKKDLKEQEIRTMFISPALNNKGWTVPVNMREEKYFTDGRVLIAGSQHSVAEGKKADYLLYHNGKPIAVVEAKDNNHAVGGGIQQAIDYALILDLKFAYSTNGDAFLEHDFITGKESELKMDEFPTEQELYNRYLAAKKYTGEEQQIVETSYYFDAYSYEPRYYQRIAIDRTVEAIARGQQRVLVVMATGTGKTYTAFQIIHRLHKSGAKKKILYLADRNILIDQTMAQDFKPFKKFMTKITSVGNGKDKIDTSYEIYMALYHQLVGKEGAPDPFLEVQPNFFDLIIVDECHRGSAKDDSAWRKVLEYFCSATQIGMTATPKAQEGANNLDYFGEPVYTYSLLQGINDGFLAPYRVTADFINIDLQGWTPEEGERDLFDKEIAQKLYQRQNIGRDLAVKARRKIVAHRITRMMHDIGRMTKTIVFCSDIEEAAEMRTLLVAMNADMCKKSPYYVTRIVGEDKEGKKQLDNFISVDEPYPVIVTTSELLSTGVDCKTCGLIVIDKEIGSMTEFKQIIGRGTRLRKDKGKWHLEILDFRNATAKFKDPDFDGDPEPPKKKGTGKYTIPEDPPQHLGEPHEKYTIEGKDIRIAHEIVSVLGEDGKTMKTESVQTFARTQIRRHFESLDNFINTWTEAERKQAIMDELKEYAILIDAVRESNPALKDADIFDIICHVAFDQPPLTRRERANNVKKRNYFGKYEGKARVVLEALLEKYAENGILDFEKANILEIPPFNLIGKPQRIIKLFGGPAKFEQALKELEQQIYKTA